MLFGQIDDPVPDLQFAVADTPVGHLDRVAAEPGSQDVDVPVDRLTGPTYRQLGDRRRAVGLGGAAADGGRRRGQVRHGDSFG